MASEAYSEHQNNKLMHHCTSCLSVIDIFNNFSNIEYITPNIRTSTG